MLCPKCNRAISLDYGQDKCPHCNELVGTDTTIKKPGEGLRPPSSESANPLVTITEDPDRPPTWDDEGPFFTRLWNTWKASMFYPNTFFSKTPTDKGIGKPLLYAIIVGSVGVIIGTLWSLLFMALKIPFFGVPMGGEMPEQFAQMQKIQMYMMLGMAVLSPLFITIGVFVGSGILHLCLMIVGGNKKGFEATFRSVTFAYSPMVFNLIPFCGGYIAGIWAIVLVIIGFKQTHQIPVWKAIVAYLIPTVLCCGCIIIVILVIGFGVFAALSQGMH